MILTISCKEMVSIIDIYMLEVVYFWRFYDQYNGYARLCLCYGSER